MEIPNGPGYPGDYLARPITGAPGQLLPGPGGCACVSDDGCAPAASGCAAAASCTVP